MTSLDEPVRKLPLLLVTCAVNFNEATLSFEAVQKILTEACIAEPGVYISVAVDLPSCGPIPVPFTTFHWPGMDS